MTFSRKKLIPLLFLIVILGMATFLRVYGLFHGMHFHPDERGNVMHVMDLSFKDLNPHFFAYGSFPLYLLFFLKEFLKIFDTFLASYDGLFYIGRIFTAIAGIATILALYILAVRFFNRRVALFAAFFLSFSVLHIQYSHFYAVDILLTLEVTLLFITIGSIYRHGRFRDYCITGILLGIGVATKVSILPILLPIVLGHFFYCHRHRLIWSFQCHRKVLLLLIVAALVFAVCQPYTFLDFEKFFHDVRQQSEMVSGKWQPPYTIQYEKTLPYVYQLDQLLSWGMGYPLALAALFGIFSRMVTLRRRFFHFEWIILLWFIVYFLITGSFFVKFLRYLLPLYPVLCLYAAVFFDGLIWGRKGQNARRIGIVFLAFTSIYIVLWSFSFLHIYSEKHPYIQASEWIYDTMTTRHTMIGEHWDDVLPVSVPGKGGKPQQIVLPLYEKDNLSKLMKMSDALEKADYIVMATKRLYGSIGRVPERYPITWRYYQALLNEKLGFRLIKSFQSYPRLFGYEIVDDCADESFSVYDHPKVLIFQKITTYSKDDIRSILAKPLEPSEKVAYTTMLEARTFGERYYHPFTVDASLSRVVRFYIFFQLISLILFPITLMLCRNNACIAYPLSKVFATIVPVYLVWLISIFSGTAISTGLFLLSLSIIIIVTFLLYEFGPSLACRLQDNSPSRWFWELIFSGVFLFFLLIRAFNPEIYWGEKPMDFAFLNSFYRLESFPVIDPWFSAKDMNYYYFGYAQAGFLGRFLGIPAGHLYNFYISLVPALAVLSCISLLLVTIKRKTFAVLMSVLIVIGGNISGLHKLIFLDKKVGFSLWWDTSRLLPSPAINEYPIWSFLFADLHAHVVNLPVVLVLFIFLYFVIKDLLHFSFTLFSRLSLNGIVLSFLLGIAGITNSWDFISASSIILGLCLLAGIGHALIRKDNRGKMRILDFIVFPLASLLLAIFIVSASFIWVLPFYLNLDSSGVDLGLVRGDFASLSQIFLHFGHFLAVVLYVLCFLFILWLKKWLPLKFQAFTKHQLLSDSIILVLSFSLVFIILLFEKQAFIVGCLLFGLAWFLTLRQRNSTPLFFGFALLCCAGAIIAGSERFYLIDRMNTIFKFYYPAWLLFGVGTSILLHTFFKLSHKARVGTSTETPSNFVRKSWNVFVRKPVFPGLIAILLLGAALFTTVSGIITAVTLQRVENKRPSLDGQKYLLYLAPDDYSAVIWLNRQVTGRPTILEAQGPSYQQYGRISMHTGLPTVLGWEHHVFQRGASRVDIGKRKQDIRTIYTTSSDQRLRELIDAYNIAYIVAGSLEKKTYGLEYDQLFSQFERNFSPVFRSGLTTVYKTDLPHGNMGLASTVFQPPSLSGIGEKKTPEMNDWEKDTFFALPLQLRSGARLTGLCSDDEEHFFITDSGNNQLYHVNIRGQIEDRMELPTSLTPLNYPTFVVYDFENYLWISDTGNNRVVGMPIAIEARTEENIRIVEGLLKPADLCFGPDKSLYIADFKANRIYHYSLITDQMASLELEIQSPLSLSCPGNDLLCIYSSLSREIVWYDLRQKRLLRSFSLPQTPGFSPTWGFLSGNGMGLLYFLDAFDGQLYEFDNRGNLKRQLNPPIEEPGDFIADYENGRCLYLLDTRENKGISLCRLPTVSMFEGGEGNLPGQFSQPRAIARDKEGNFYVADTRNNRIQKFDAAGNYLLQWGEKGELKGQFDDPMGIDVGPDSLIYIADTWNQRIQVFNTQGEFIRQWEDQFYGPREVITDDAGRIYVADTGNGQVKVYNELGKRLRIIGKKGSSPGNLLEPIGMAIFDDHIAICDTGNKQIDVFSLNGRFIRTFDMDLWTTGQREPYISYLDNNFLIVSEPEKNRLLIINDNGEIIDEVSRAGARMMNKPRDMEYDSESKTLYIVDTWNHRISAYTFTEPPF